MVNATDTLSLKKEEVKAPEVKKKLKEYLITFHSGANNDNSDVTISHNHVINVYQRNKQVKINENYLSVLKDAVIDTEIRGEDGKTQRIRIQPYTYSVEEIPAEG